MSSTDVQARKGLTPSWQRPLVGASSASGLHMEDNTMSGLQLARDVYAHTHTGGASSSRLSSPVVAPTATTDVAYRDAIAPRGAWLPRVSSPVLPAGVHPVDNVERHCNGRYPTCGDEERHSPHRYFDLRY